MTDRQHLRKAIHEAVTNCNREFDKTGRYEADAMLDEILAAVDAYVLDLIGEDEDPSIGSYKSKGDVADFATVARNDFRHELRERLVKGEHE